MIDVNHSKTTCPELGSSIYVAYEVFNVDPYTPKQITFDLNNPKVQIEYYYTEKFNEVQEFKSLIIFHTLLFLSGTGIGYGAEHFYYFDKNNIVTAELGKYPLKFLGVTDTLEMVKGELLLFFSFKHVH